MSNARENVEKLRDIVSVRAFGAKGDGSTNDTAAFIAAATSAAALKQMLFIPGGTYVVGNWTPPASLYVYGAGAANTILRRPASASTNDAVVNLTAGSVTLENLTVDGNKANNALASQCIAITSQGNYTMRGLTVRNAKSVGGFGVGISVSSTNDETSLTQTIIEDCVLTGNDSSGISVDECWNIRIEGCRASSNTASGISVANFDTPIEPSSQRSMVIANNFCAGNTDTGIQVAGTTVANIVPPIGQQQPYNIIVQGNDCRDNGGYGIVCQGTGINCTGNQTFGNGSNDPVAAGILFNCYHSICANNICISNIFFGIDAGGSYESAICDNTCAFNGNATATPTGIGINVGGSVSVSCDDNTLVNNGGQGAATGIQIYCVAYEYGGGGGTPYRTSAVSISNNMISMVASTQVGIEVRQGGDGLVVQGNLIRGSTSNNAIQIATDSFNCSNNVFLDDIGGTSIASATTLVVPDWSDTISITGTTAITDIKSYSQNAYFEKVAWVEVTNGGSGYTSAPTVSFSGGGGSNAAATAYIGSAGTVTGVLLSNYGSGYTSAPAVAFTGGGGSSAAATAQVGVPNRIGRKMTLVFGDASSVSNANNVFLSGGRTFFASSSGSDTLSLIGMYGTNWQETGRQSSISEAYSNTAPAADIAAVGNAINTRGKYAGRSVYDTTNNRLMVASGSNANSAWYRADGGASVTPS
jgi:parallel beta-helix repeat protein